jgi:hypothetical protein
MVTGLMILDQLPNKFAAMQNTKIDLFPLLHSSTIPLP